MQKLLDQLSTRLRAFVGQRDQIALVMRCRDEEAPVILKSLEGIDEGAESEMFWIASDEFGDAPSWVSSIVNAFAVKHGAVRMAMGKEGYELWPELPDRLLDEARQPAERLRELMIFSRELLPEPNGMLAVWCFVPLEIRDACAYATLMQELLQHQFPNPWSHHMRVYLRGDPADQLLPTALSTIPRIAWYDPDLSQTAIQLALEEEAADRSLPLERRLQSLLMSAGVDYSNQRFDDALSKYAVLLKYYTSKRDTTMTALVLNAIGETHTRTGNADAANKCFELAFIPAAAAPVPPVPVMLNLTLNLANLNMSRGYWAEAELYYDSAQRLAMAQRDAETRLRALENLGVCQYAQGKVAEAVGVWHAGATVAAELRITTQQQSMLSRLARHYHDANDQARFAQLQHELSLLAQSNGSAEVARA